MRIIYILRGGVGDRARRQLSDGVLIQVCSCHVYDKGGAALNLVLVERVKLPKYGSSTLLFDVYT